MPCPACGTENEFGRKFCGECGAPLARICPSCGNPNPPTVKFCGECGAALVDGLAGVASGTPGGPSAPATTAAPSATTALGAPIAERRLVSVLFADLVGFTTLSEARDAEEVRELLSRYFETCRTIITRYGGVVEKFIGDAVMAVWGAPVATEDDAERAVRAALELTTAVATLGEESGAPDLRARAGVLTGEAAVSIGAEGQGMVAGDMVNTASRIQTAAQPGAVLVGEGTKRSTEATVVYEHAGEFELKGKVGLLPLWRAIRVIAGARGTLKSTGLEPPFVGRNGELRMIKELFHASAEDGKAHLVSVTGVAGIGKSRLSWEFYKYFDGLQLVSLYHRGRCIAYGEGVAYWALAEMVKMRCRIAEEEDAAPAWEKLRSTLDSFVTDTDERRWVEPRLAHLLGLEERTAADREDLFAAWRLFFERLAGQDPVVMIFEDLQWADDALLDFVEYLLEWSRAHRIFVLTLSRPELATRRPTWGAGGRNVTSIYLERLPEVAMRELLSGLVPGLPEEIGAQILERAQGVPLYAVETVRMLLDRGLLAQEGNVYRPTGPIETLEVPETLHALIAARLDGLTSDERRIVQDGAVLGKTFFKEGVARVSGMPEPAVEEILSSLVRKEILSVQADPRSPERGQYGFLQDLLKTVAYETLSKHDRKAKHLAAAAFIGETWADDDAEVVEVLASHYLQAYGAVPDAEDAAEIRSRARTALAGAGERAASLGASAGAQRYFEQAAELAEDDATSAGLLERAGRMALRDSRYTEATDLLGRAVDLYGHSDDLRPQARASAALAEAEWYGEAKIEEPLRRMAAAYDVLAAGGADEPVAALAHEIARFHYFAGHVGESEPWIERSLELAESLWLPEVLSNALNTKAVLLRMTRPEEAMALLTWALKIAEEHDLSEPMIRAVNNLGVALGELDRYEEAIETFGRLLDVSRRLGMRQAELTAIGSTLSLWVDVGRWDEALEAGERLLPEIESAARDVSELLKLVVIHTARGEPERGRAIVDAFASFADSDEPQMRASFDTYEGLQLLAEEDPSAAFASAERALDVVDVIGIPHDSSKWGFVLGLSAASALGDERCVRSLLERIEAIPPGLRSPMYRAQAMRFRAKLAGTDDPEALSKSAVGLFRELGTPLSLAVTILEYAELLAARGRKEAAEPLLAEAREIFERLGATPWLARLDAAAGLAVEGIAAS